MAYLRKQVLSRSSTFKEEIRRSSDDDNTTTSSAALPHKASDPRLDLFRSRAFHSSFNNRSKVASNYDYSSTRSTTNEPRGFWSVLARKAKAILDDEVPQHSNASCSMKPETLCFSTGDKFSGIQVRHQYGSSENSIRITDSSTLKKGLNRLKSTLDQIDTSGSTLKADKNIQKRRPIMDSEQKDQIQRPDLIMQSPQPHRNQEIQLQASRDIAIVTAAKVKQLARELKSVKAELAFAKERYCQLEEENKMLREAREGDNIDDEDMIRVQLETLLAEKGRLAHENAVYALENRYLREIAEFHQLNMQDVVYLDESDKEVEVTQANNLLPNETSQNSVETSSPNSNRSE